MTDLKEDLRSALADYRSTGIETQVDYDKFYLYSLITHSTAIEGSTVTAVENQLLFDEGIAAAGRPMAEQLMNLDLRSAYARAKELARASTPVSVPMLCSLSALVMKNTGSHFSAPGGEFDSSRGDLRRFNVTAGPGGASYLSYLKVETHLEGFCRDLNRRIANVGSDEAERYLLTFDAHLDLVTIHPWVDGNGRMARLLMNFLQWRLSLIPSRVDKARKSDYIQALVDSRAEQSREPFRRFMLREHTRNLRAEAAACRAGLEG